MKLLDPGNGVGQARERAWASAVAMAGLILTLAAWGQEPTANLSFLVVKDYNGRPVRNASVILHPVNDKGKQSRGGFELKTNDDGKTAFDGVPYGKLRVQVMAEGFQTFGQDYDIQEPTLDLKIKLKRPQAQYSIYGDSKNTPKVEPPPKKDDAPAPKDDKANEKPNPP